jgi:hypothetical protein
MPWAAGSYTKGNSGTGGWVGDASLGIGIEAGRHDTQDNDFATGINQCLNKDGSNAATGNLNLGGFIPTNLGAGTAAAPAICAGNDVNTGVFGPAADTWAVATNGTEKLRVDSTGQVGIGTTAPGFIVDVQSTATNIVGTRFSANTNPSQLILRKSRGATVGTNTIVSTNDSIGGLYFQGANGTGYTDAAGILCEIDGTPGASNDMPGRLAFFTTPDGSGSPIERMRIHENGNVTIGDTTKPTGTRFSAKGIDATASNFVVAFSSSTTLLFYIRNDGVVNTGTAANSPYNLTTGAAANLNVDAGGTLGRSTSSLKYKKDIENMSYGLDKVLALRPVTYKGKGQNDGDKIYGGLIAEEVDAAGLPEFVQYANDGTPDALNYGNMVALAFKAIQELHAKVEALEARVAELEA